jgi:asparagine synthase (glutamine-hydrolysing)
MCGIAGIVSFDVAPSHDALQKMAGALIHRGPDDEGLFVDGPCGFAFRRLAIIDLATGQQPMSAQRCTVAFNGEIYNYRELKALLVAEGHSFRTTSDTEVLLHAYLQWGADFSRHIDGMFAVAIWDATNQTLHAARDRFGKKPFYFTVKGRQLLFASELKALRTHSECPRELDREAFHRYLAFEYVPSPKSILKGVYKLEAGHQLAFNAKGLRQHAYYSLPAARARPLTEELRFFSKSAVQEASSQLLTKLSAAVKRRLVADVPVGVFLSGGIDSTAVTALAVRESGHKVQTFSVAFDDAQFDESAYARTAAASLGTDHHEAHLSAQHCLDLVPKLAEQLDEPFADASYLPTFLLSQFTKQKVTVALGGDGADELFAGYDTFVAHGVGQLAHHLPASVLQTALRAAELLPTSTGYMSLEFKLRTFLQGVVADDTSRHQAWIGSFQPAEIVSLLTPAFRPVAPDDVYAPIRAFAQSRNERGLEWVLRYYFTFYLADDILTKVDRASMAASLEVRSPFLDTDLVDFVFKQPLHYKLRPWGRKWLLRQALRGIVPDPILRRAKHGFALPVAQWLNGPLRELREDLLGESALKAGGIFEPAAVRQLIEDHDLGRADRRKQLWTLLMFELWRRRWAHA